MKKHLYIVRHGETELNKQGICQGQKHNSGLNDTGCSQATQLAHSLIRHNIGAIYSSPLLRALETADIIASHLNLNTKLHDGLIEGNFGVAEGVNMAIVKSWDSYKYWSSPDPKYASYHYEHGESKIQILDRVMQSLADICANEPADNILLVSHSAIVRLLNWYVGNFIQGMPNGAIYEFEYEDGQLKALNSKLLLLSCCAPCSCAVIKTLAEQHRNFDVVFYNPNIRPYAEYLKRMEENKRVCRLYGVPFIELEYDNERWCELTKGLENEPEQGKRCNVCFYMRIKRVMEYAKEHGYTAVSSVLGVSRYKNLAQVNLMAEKAAQAAEFTYSEIEGRKYGMQDLRQQLIKDLDLYNQDYCGCKPRQS